jgi:phosphomannomutase/phosphoglucomutase
MKITKEINEHIFRGYDIRGVYERDLNEDVAYTIGKAFGTKLINEGKNKTLIGYDNRLSSIPLHDALVKGITETGIDVIDIGLVTTPMYYYGLTLLKTQSGIMITGSHNPKDENGFKMSFNGINNAYGEYIQEFKKEVLNQDFISGNGTIIKENINDKYVEYITSSIKLGGRKLKVVVDCGNGTASVIIKDVLDRINIDYVPLYWESDSTFPNHHPDPSVEHNMEALKNKVIETNADFGIAYDGDADRVGFVDENGNMITTDYFLIIVARDIIKKLEDKRFLFDVKCSKALSDEIKKLGGNPICYRTGNSYLRMKVVEDKLPIAGEYSGHVFFNDKFHGFDDGIYASLRMIEILSNTDKKMSELLDGINTYYSTEEIKVKVADEIKFEIIDKITDFCKSKNYELLLIDGCKALFDDSSALVRASNTGPNITMKFEATTENRLKEIQEEFTNLLNKLI